MPGMVALPPWSAKASIMQREDQMHPNMFALATQCPAFPVREIFSLLVFLVLSSKDVIELGML